MRCFSLVLCAAALSFTVQAAKAEDAPKAEAAPAAAPALDPKLEARLAAEKEARKQCKTEICNALAGKATPGAVACDATKTWVDADIGANILGGYISWPWGHATCSAHIDLDGAALAKLVSDPEATVKLKKHSLKCLVDKKGGEGKEADSYVLKLAVAPDVTFKNGKATAVKLNWSDVDAPALLQGAVWSATTLDKTFDVLSGSSVKQINAFLFQSCKEVGVEIPEKK